MHTIVHSPVNIPTTQVSRPSHFVEHDQVKQWKKRIPSCVPVIRVRIIGLEKWGGRRLKQLTFLETSVFSSNFTVFLKTERDNPASDST
jgi:hypothetical protein